MSILRPACLVLALGACLSGCASATTYSNGKSRANCEDILCHWNVVKEGCECSEVKDKGLWSFAAFLASVFEREPVGH